MIRGYIFNDDIYIPATEAGKHFGYTKEYMLMLIKRGKIEGRKVKHKWYVHLPSTEVYLTEAAESRTLRLQKLSEDRKQEFIERIATVPVDVSLDTANSTSTTLQNPPVVSNYYARLALLETLVIVFLGVSVASMGYISAGDSLKIVEKNNYNSMQALAISVFSFVSGEDI